MLHPMHRAVLGSWVVLWVWRGEAGFGWSVVVSAPRPNFCLCPESTFAQPCGQREMLGSSPTDPAHPCPSPWPWYTPARLGQQGQSQPGPQPWPCPWLCREHRVLGLGLLWQQRCRNEEYHCVLLWLPRTQRVCASGSPRGFVFHQARAILQQSLPGA